MFFFPALFDCSFYLNFAENARDNNFTNIFHALFSVKPLTIEIRKLNGLDTGSESLKAGEPYEVECETTGSRPPAVITWYKGKRQLKHVKVRNTNL